MRSLLDSMRLSAPVTVTWEVTGRCNLACRHCLAADGPGGERDLSTDEALDLLRRLAAWGVFQVNLGGGEPLLREDFLELMGAGVDAGMLMCVSTNGKLVRADLARQLGALGDVAVQVSFDGARPQTHAAVRGPGSYAPALAAVQLLAGAGVRTALNTVVTRQNLPELDDLYRLAGVLGADLRLSRLRPSGRARSAYYEMQLTPGEFEALGDWLGEHPDVRTGDSFFFLGEGASREATALDGCGASRLTLCIDPAGDVYPCAFLTGPSWRLGNVRHDGLADLWAGEACRSAAAHSTSVCLACLDLGCRRECPARASWPADLEAARSTAVPIA